MPWIGHVSRRALAPVVRSTGANALRLMGSIANQRFSDGSKPDGLYESNSRTSTRYVWLSFEHRSGITRVRCTVLSHLL
jgi:hypothetical protein